MITFVPVGGLANRMRSMEAAIFLAHDLQTDLHIIWYKDWGLNCRFDQLFQPLDVAGVTLKEASLSDVVFNDRPRKRNLFIPSLFQRIKFDSRIYEEKATRLFYDNFDFKQWARGKNVYLASCIAFYGAAEKYAYTPFKPLIALKDQIDTIASAFNDSTMGVHIRRTDHTTAISTSPTEMFIERMQAEVDKNKDTKFYLATDSEEDKKHLIDIFGDRIITSPRKADRGSLQGMQDALIEMYLLSKTRYIIGSFKSTYSETAAQIGNIQCEVIQRQD